MSVLSDLRKQVTAALNDADLHAFDVVPAKWTPPGVFVGPGVPYLTREGATFGGEIVRLSVTVVTARGTNTRQADQLDDLLLKVLDALYAIEPDGFDVGEVDRPGTVAINGQTHLGASVSIATQIHR